MRHVGNIGNTGAFLNGDFGCSTASTCPSEAQAYCEAEAGCRSFAIDPAWTGKAGQAAAAQVYKVGLVGARANPAWTLWVRQCANSSRPWTPRGRLPDSPNSSGKPLPSVGLGDAPRVEPATPADPSDPLLREWVKTQPGPVVFDGVPCSFPGRVWKSKVGEHWNMLCAFAGSGKGPWARYSSTDPRLMTWKLADLNFTNVHGGAAAGALFHALPGAPTAAEGGPTHMISANGGAGVYLGTYNETTEKLNITSKVAQGTGGDGAWAAVGTNGPDPMLDGDRLVSTSWIMSHGGSTLSLLRDLRYERATGMLLAWPTPELDLLHNLTVIDGQPLGTVGAVNGTKILPYPAAVGGTSDTTVSVAIPASNKTGLSFGIAVRTAPGTLAHAGGIAHVMVSPVDPKTGQRRATVGFGAFAEDGLQSPWGSTGSRRPGVALGSSNNFPILPGENVITVRVLVDRSVAEAFMQGGRAGIITSDNRYTDANSSVTIFNNGAAPLTVTNASAYGMGCGWFAD